MHYWHLQYKTQQNLKFLQEKFILLNVRFHPNTGSTLLMDKKDKEFDALVNAYSADIYRFCYWLCKDASLAEDMTQETFARAWKALDSLVDPKAAKAWLITIARREIARHFTKKRIETVDIQDIPLEQLGTDDNLSQQDNLAIHEAIASLNNEYREPLLLQVLAGFSCKEIASMLGIKSGAVMTRVFRAKQQLRQVLDPDNDRKDNIVVKL